MSQVSDYTLSNIGFSAFRTELNSILGAVNTLNAGTSAPGSVAAGSLWLDTTNATTPTLKFYDGSDQISLCTFNYSANTVNWLDSTVSADLSGDSSPQLGGDLDVVTYDIVSTSNRDIDIAPHGTGDVVLKADTVTVGDAAAAATIRSSGAGTLTVTTGGTTDLILSTNNGTASSNVTITDAANGDVTVNPNGSGLFHIAGNSTQAGTLKLTEDTDDGSNFVAMKAPNVSTSYTMTLPTAVAGGNDYVLKSTTGGVLSWGEASGGGTSWQAVVTGTTQTAVAGNGYFINTTSNVCTVTLPAGTIGDQVSLIDYAGTFDSNALTVAANGSEKIHASTADLTVTVERAAFTLVYTDGTQGWLLTNN